MIRDPKSVLFFPRQQYTLPVSIICGLCEISSLFSGPGSHLEIWFHQPFISSTFFYFYVVNSQFYIALFQTAYILFRFNLMIICFYPTKSFEIVIMDRICCRLSIRQKILVLTADITNLSNCNTLQMSLIYNMNNYGPNTEPWGALHVMAIRSDVWSPIYTSCRLSVGALNIWFPICCCFRAATSYQPFQEWELEFWEEALYIHEHI